MCEQIQEENIKDRIKEIREDAGLSQKDFGSKVKLSRSQISCYEKGIRDATDRSIKDICREFDVNENWLRFGEGEKYSINEKDSLLAEVLAEITISDNIPIKEIIIKLCELDEEYLDLINKLIDGLLKK
ncbi:TPA: helix-turn-helix domain-containing protein [Clostridioides difficile]|uniref:DNA-binding helix-turn-helix protein n=1 Tax=Clostridium phage phiCD111 TaxID=1582150 RepID=A0A0A8WE86_9CAUD|nr:helix-turn-helix domain-containing protein [Clostridioides difficile]YP_009208391.1 transcriptional regulator [Clostridium phage phiCD111]MBH7988000.1 helix-turn-helix domain-containing protein [Clostridioides difficile]MBN5924667.1 helix-turn-helix domain-containing protein [Clostridioides difficile]MBS7776187.1 helix-turn-helix domain-containing protein [Clostridioides difficile]MCJ0119733.1 helix-turn-helix domain-containing protein [Clostridioides difficile]MCL6898742.1 helix-turn-heli